MNHLASYLVVGAALFCIGLFGVATQRNIVRLMMSVELILAGVIINLVVFGAFHHNAIGQVFGLFVLGLAAAEVAVGLGLVMMVARNAKTIDMKMLDEPCEVVRR